VTRLRASGDAARPRPLGCPLHTPKFARLAPRCSLDPARLEHDGRVPSHMPFPAAQC
jgi:hypothetical protein